ncbi:unnamed protein product [Phyllotreta striolata]|uniref:CDAN1-interacting nuclease 1 n=1 Tax=Phyllotreta striolata TaxID=444603 RepID=A0A9N9XQH7_PHYSR|nr:unnamed protein product [Phyllotreta striolata]
MNLTLYNNIISTIRNHKGLSIDCYRQLVDKFPSCSGDSLYSILQFEYQRRMKTNHSLLHSNKQNIWQSYVNSVKERERSGIILRIAENLDVAPCLVAKIILHRYFDEFYKDNNEEQPVSNINVYLRETSLINDPKLAYEVYLCTLYDNIYSPVTDVMKSSLGQQYEIRLNREATELGLGFRDEEHLRKHGYDKTPDCKLEVPICIKGFIINWIESKALFGETEVHKEYIKNQYTSYYNRFGPGLVIYWFGYLETIVQDNEKRFVISDHLPRNFARLPPPNFEF